VIVVVADTKIFVSALQFGGVPLAFLDYARAGAFRLGISGPLLAELREVLGVKFAWSEEEITAALSQLADCSVRVDPTEMLDAFLTTRTIIGYLSARLPRRPDSSCRVTITFCAWATIAAYVS
jgi:hypothetical protein